MPSFSKNWARAEELFRELVESVGGRSGLTAIVRNTSGSTTEQYFGSIAYRSHAPCGRKKSPSEDSNLG